MLSDNARWTKNLSRRILSNGLTSLVQTDWSSPAVGIVIYVKAGFFDEPDHWQGVSHVLEHMFFKGTPTRGVGQLAAEIKSLGGYVNAWTSYDATAYLAVLPAEGFRRALAVQADALRNMLVDRGELERELQVIIEEAKRKLDTPAAVSQETLHAVLFDQHRIRRWRIGTERQLSGFTRDDIVGYHRTRYLPSRVVVSIVGAVDREAAHQAVMEEFSDWAAAPDLIEPSPEEPWRVGARAKTIRGDVRQAQLVVGWRGVPEGHPDSYALDLASMVLSAGRGGWLFRALRLPGLVTSIGASHYSPSEVGVFSISADLPADGVSTALGAIAGQLRRLGEIGPSEHDLIRVKTLLEARWARRMESVEGRAGAFADAEARGDHRNLEAEYARYQETATGDIRRVVSRYLGSGSVAAVGYFPHENGRDLQATELEAVFGAATLGPAFPGEPPEGANHFPRRPLPSQGRFGVHLAAHPSTDILTAKRPGAPLVSLGLYRRRSSEEPRQLAGVGALAVRSMARGAGRFDSSAQAAAFEWLGGSLGVNLTYDWFGVSCSVLKSGMAEALALLKEALYQPHFDPDEVARERATLMAEAVDVHDDMFRFPTQLALATAFGPRRYGLPVRGSEDSLGSITLSDVVDWHRGELTRGRAVVVAVGDFDPVDATEQIAGILGDDSLISAAEPGPRAFWSREAERDFAERHKSQTAFSLLFPGPSRTDPDRHAASVLAAVASGLGGRLFQALRDQRSLAYTVVVSSWQWAQAGAFLGYLATSPHREDEARLAMLDELTKFRTTLISDEELTRAVNYLGGQAAVHRQTVSGFAAEIADAWIVGTGLDELDDPSAPYRQVTREAVREVARRYLDPDRMVEGVVRGGMSG